MGFVRAMSSKAVTTGAARNGDGPVPVSTYQDSGFVADQGPGGDRGQGSGRRARAPASLRRGRLGADGPPGRGQLTVLGRKTAKEMSAITEGVKPLLPA
jgi:multiple sugar transport system substrate-binding protein